ncbi:MlaE family ABC transporter permease [Azospirillum sp.]|uniref:MlaE family ABC transporter permease n=1 Tax=Azospirillum sp. TaxID=34012 RepID=UPI003D74305A
MTAGQAWMKTAPGGDGALLLTVGGRWDLHGAQALMGDLDALRPSAPEAAVCLDLAAVDGLDTVGALLLARLAERLRGEGHAVEVTGVRPEHRALVDAVHEADRAPPVQLPDEHPIIEMLERTGRTTVRGLKRGLELVNFLGVVTVTLARIAVNPRRLRYRSVLFHIEQTGLNALPILGLLTFLIGVVMAYQGADQLRRFGAELLVVNLLGISILRELGTLLTAIIVAGRSGSAFTAQIGTMKVNQEVDAISTLGLDPIELLVVPRVLALMVALPLLAFFADVMALLGGATMSYMTLGISFAQFIKQLQGAVGLNTFLVGVAKAPVFALVIAMVGCYEGLRVTGSAESVGRLTTRSVVEGIFLVIIMDALFSIFFSFMGV